MDSASNHRGSSLVIRTMTWITAAIMPALLTWLYVPSVFGQGSYFYYCYQTSTTGGCGTCAQNNNQYYCNGYTPPGSTNGVCLFTVSGTYCISSPTNCGAQIFCSGGGFIGPCGTTQFCSQ
jgi:hypothetical protein